MTGQNRPLFVDTQKIKMNKKRWKKEQMKLVLRQFWHKTQPQKNRLLTPTTGAPAGGLILFRYRYNLLAVQLCWEEFQAPIYGPDVEISVALVVLSFVERSKTDQ